MNWKERSPGPELLDGDAFTTAELIQNLQELELINRRLGGHATTLTGLRRLLQGWKPERPLRIAEIGSGGGDNLRAVHGYLERRGIAHELIGIDLKPDCINYARKALAGLPVTWVCCDYRLADGAGALRPDIIFSSLFCHHFSGEALVPQLQWMDGQARVGWFINDLHRHVLAFQSIRLLTQLFSRSRLVKHDAPLSVCRGFLLAEWRQLLQEAGLGDAQLEWRWAFRHLIWKRHEPRAAF